MNDKLPASKRFLNHRGILISLIGALLLGALITGLAVSSTASRDNQAGFTAITPGTSGQTLHLPLIRKPFPDSGKPIFGVNFISSAEEFADEQRYQNGLSTGATFNRWPFYWPIVEYERDQFNWSTQDANVIADMAHGLNVNAILLGTPGFYSTASVQDLVADRTPKKGMFQMDAAASAVPEGLYKPVFSDGSDVPGPGKLINQENKWARYVYMAVERYRPGGVLAKLQGWAPEIGIRYWEMWNEPDHPWFLISGNPADYARMLKVGYLAAKTADPMAQVIFAGLANHFEKLTFYDDVLAIYDTDPQASGAGYYHDIMATHNYSNSWRSWYHVWRAGRAMENHGLSKPIWLNENGVPTWDDYPGPVWDPNSPFRGTMDEQADFAIQSAFYATYAGAEAIFHFQLYDGCGNQPAGSDFPPHNGDLCKTLDVCAGDANGLFRNATDAVCFTQHPQPETPRPNYAAFKVLTEYFKGVQPLWRERPGVGDPAPQEWIAFYQPSSGKRIVGMWSRVGQDQLAEIEATANNAVIIRPDGSVELAVPENGFYKLILPKATNLNTSGDGTPFGIGGPPLILIESDPGASS